MSLDPKKLPVLITEKEVRALLGKLPRDLEDMVVCDPKHKPPRKLFVRDEVIRRMRK